MDTDDLSRHAQAVFDDCVPPEERHAVDLAVDPTRTHDPLWPDVRATASFTVTNEGRVVVTAAAGAVSEAELETAIRGAVTEGLAARDVRADLLGEDALYGAHALFRAGEPAPVAFHRAGPEIAPGAYVVDLDVFVELRVPEDTFSDLRGKHLRIALDEDGIELELPEDAEPEEVLTLPEAGLLEADDELDEDDVMPPAGDLHVVVVLYGARQATTPGEPFETR